VRGLPEHRLPRVVVCGTDFGRTYLAAFRDPDFPFELAGVLARGSVRSKACAAAYGVPLFTDPDELPPDVDIACVVVSGSINGGPGVELAKTLLARGIHVLQEHPLHQAELADCVRVGHRSGAVHQVNTHYVHIEPVRRFVDAARALCLRQRPLFVDAMVAVQVTYTLFDILGRALDSLRPWAFADPPGVDALGGDLPPAYRSLDGVLGGVPLTLRVQQDMDPAQPDNFTHLFHRITLGTEGGHLTLVDTHGPVLWSPRPHMPADTDDLVAFEDTGAEHIDFPTTDVLGPATAPTYRQVLADVWPDGVRHALTEFAGTVRGERDWRATSQYHLGLCAITQQVNARLGGVRVRHHARPPEILSAEVLVGGASR
jgi:pyochelin biosynthesis protein PchG